MPDNMYESWSPYMYGLLLFDIAPTYVYSYVCGHTPWLLYARTNSTHTFVDSTDKRVRGLVTMQQCTCEVVQTDNVSSDDCS